MKIGIIPPAVTRTRVLPVPGLAKLGTVVMALALSLPATAVRSAGAEPEFYPPEMARVQQLRERILKKSAKPAPTPQPYTESIAGTIVTFSMVPIPAGTFTLGSPAGEKGRQPDEGPQKKVSLRAFWMGKCEVTWDQYELFMFAPELTGTAETGGVDGVSSPTKPYTDMSFGMGVEGFPAVCMTHHAAAKYCEWLSAKTGNYYRLPTEAEWEYAARAGTTTAYSFGDDPALLPEYACFKAEKYLKVGAKKPNPWGLHDMHGNVMEWTLDQYLPDAYSRLKGNPSVGSWIRSTQPYPHVVRGGSWNDSPEQLRSAARAGSSPEWKKDDPQLPKSIWYHSNAPWVGFRVVRPMDIPSAEEMYRCWNNGVAADK